MGKTTTVEVTVEVIEHLRGTYDIDEADFADWLVAHPGYADRHRGDQLVAYLRDSDDFEVVRSVSDSATRRGTRELWSTSIDSVTEG